MHRNTHGGRGRFRPQFRRGGGNAGGRGGPRRFAQRIDYARFINKAVPVAEVIEYVPEHSFADFKIAPMLMRSIAARGYSAPTPIQDKSIPRVLEGSDLVGIADTGTGKTAAFLVPILNKVMAFPREKALIVVPTRELALQIHDELKAFARGMQIYSVCCVGGMSIGRQMSDLRRHHNFVIGTPGRLKDLVNRGNIRLSEFRTIVLDEADRMLDMGFIADMRFLMAGMPADRQTLFFSATISNDIEKLISQFLKSPVRVSTKTRDTARSIEQDIVRVGGRAKLDVLHDLLIKEGFSKVLVFGQTKHGVENLSNKLVERGFKASSIHGNKNHSGRQRALSLFKENHIQVLVATDVAARGLDVADISHVINYDIPSTFDDYVHRIGRTGRGNKRGMALTFIDAI